jgi:spore coat polysaccharide biosynthesis protein SpsF
MSSSRLPGKVLLDIAGKPMLARVVERTQQSRSFHRVIVATTTDPSDDPVEALCLERSYPCYRGSVHDVLDRYYQAALLEPVDVVVRITADCPVIDPQLIDLTVKVFLGQASDGPPHTRLSELTAAVSNPAYPYDFAANRLPPPWGRTYPIGLDTEVCTFEALKIAWQEAEQPHQREHVMPFFYEQPERFRMLHINHGAVNSGAVNSDRDYGDLRWTVDTPEDLELLRQIYAHFPGRDDFSWLEILSLIKQVPSLARINDQVRPKDYREIDTRQQSTH